MLIYVYVITMVKEEAMNLGGRGESGMGGGKSRNDVITFNLVKLFLQIEEFATESVFLY